MSRARVGSRLEGVEIRRADLIALFDFLSLAVAADPGSADLGAQLIDDLNLQHPKQLQTAVTEDAQANVALRATACLEKLRRALNRKGAGDVIRPTNISHGEAAAFVGFALGFANPFDGVTRSLLEAFLSNRRGSLASDRKVVDGRRKLRGSDRDQYGGTRAKRARERLASVNQAVAALYAGDPERHAAVIEEHGGTERFGERVARIADALAEIRCLSGEVARTRKINGYSAP